MAGQFVSPNWHAVIVHYPLALLSAGVGIELLSLFWKRSGIRVAARWMILLGALAAIPTAMTGLYALRDAAAHGGELDRPWSQIAADSHWTDDQWLYMTRHIWLTSIGAGLALLASAAWLAASDTTRQRAHLPTLLALLIAMGFIGTGAWYAGEGVYRMGVAVRAPEPGVPAASAEHQAEKGSAARLNYFAPPLQTHVLAAGLMAALGLAAVAATLRRWSATSRSSIGDTSELQLTGDDLHPVESRDASGEPLPRGGAFVPPARFWLLALLAGAAAATAGLWTAEDFSLSMFKDVLTKADVRADNRILFLHILLGLSLVALTLFLAILTRASRGLKLIAGLLMLAVLAAAGFQVWMGIKLMYGG